ncbi:hypothetical protein G6F70_001935 [Rhizopus microsporus]|uniref:FAD/NAD(P)-binding domain-containing protein n=1 Tax=Rhizopus azygosporus TaxID=86630 RepID=A0A367JTP7_RHIAZ|nr:hypothetical protein G6F71_002081 [Rhizopus microsporus]KAG1202792.1 hypothetical protein G6F70_001935 [Rhizopus microsporus]RCH93320.1 hypothetical protein CU097_007760 [Rhizopus azygosporus]
MKKLVILGGGAAGFMVAVRLRRSKISDMDVVLVDNKAFFEYTPALCSVLYEKTDEEFQRHFMDITFDYETTLKKMNVKFVLGSVQDLKDNQVLVATSEDEVIRIDYDYVTICTGSSYADPWKTNDITYTLSLETRLAYLKEQRQAYLTADSILCIGGGPVGVEVVSEISYRSPQKAITLINSGEQVLSSAPANLGKHAQRILEHRENIVLIMNEKAEKKAENVYETDKTHRQIKADLVYNCIGVKPNSEFLKESHADWLDEKGYIHVERTLNVRGTDNVFAIGDINNIGEPKLYYIAHMQALHCVRNLSRVLSGQEMVPYHSASPAMFISMGPHYSVGTISGIIQLTGWPFNKNKGSKIAAWLKYIIEKVSVQGGSSIEVLMNETLYLYNNAQHVLC